MSRRLMAALQRSGLGKVSQKLVRRSSPSHTQDGGDVCDCSADGRASSRSGVCRRASSRVSDSNWGERLKSLRQQIHLASPIPGTYHCHTGSGNGHSRRCDCLWRDGLEILVSEVFLNLQTLRTYHRLSWSSNDLHDRGCRSQRRRGDGAGWKSRGKRQCADNGRAVGSSS